jgi:hypothetical protein
VVAAKSVIIEETGAAPPHARRRQFTIVSAVITLDCQGVNRLTMIETSEPTRAIALARTSMCIARRIGIRASIGTKQRNRDPLVCEALRRRMVIRSARQTIGPRCLPGPRTRESPEFPFLRSRERDVPRSPAAASLCPGARVPNQTDACHARLASAKNYLSLARMPNLPHETHRAGQPFFGSVCRTDSAGLASRSGATRCEN